jgi:hypothetical protein
MNESALRRRRLWSVPALLATLVLTTGWMQAAPPTATTTTSSVSRAADDLALLNPRLETLRGGSPTRDQHPQRTFAAPVKPAVKPAPKPATTPTTTPVPTSAARSYSGRNHFWIPSLGISQQVYSYACGRTTNPANLIYRWGCAGANNVYLLGHAYGVMKPLHDAYESGRLHVGMIAIYADANGRIRSYRVTSWQVVRPTVVAWATASQPVPSMTLQTCVGSRSQYRLDVRLVAVN